MAVLATLDFLEGSDGDPLTNLPNWNFSGEGVYDSAQANSGAMSAHLGVTNYGQFTYDFGDGTPASQFRLRTYFRRGFGTLSDHPFLVNLADNTGGYIGDFQVRNSGGGRFRIRWGYNAHYQEAASDWPNDEWTRVDLLYRGKNVAVDAGASDPFGGTGIGGWMAIVYTAADDSIEDYRLLDPSFGDDLRYVRVGNPANSPGSPGLWLDDVLLQDTLDDPGPAGGSAFSPLDISWLHAFWADQPGFTPPADGADLPAAPDNLGADAATTTPANVWGRYLTAADGPNWVTDMGGTGKPAISQIGVRGLQLVLGGLIGSPRTVVVVGRAKGTTDADLFDTTSSRTLIDTSGGVWRLYAGNTAMLSGGPASDTDPHLFIAEFGTGAGNDQGSLQVDDGTPFTGTVGTNTGGAEVQVGYSSSGSGSVDGTEIAFIGVIDRVLTAQEKADLWAWYQADYSGVPEPPAPGGIMAADITGVQVGTTLMQKVYIGANLWWERQGGGGGGFVDGLAAFLADHGAVGTAYSFNNTDVCTGVDDTSPVAVFADYDTADTGVYAGAGLDTQSSPTPNSWMDSQILVDVAMLLYVPPTLATGSHALFHNGGGTHAQMGMIRSQNNGATIELGITHNRSGSQEGDSVVIAERGWMMVGFQFEDGSGNMVLWVNGTPRLTYDRTLDLAFGSGDPRIGGGNGRVISGWSNNSISGSGILIANFVHDTPSRWASTPTTNGASFYTDYYAAMT